jgi:DNA-binding XRE family transcriptional regulator
MESPLFRTFSISEPVMPKKSANANFPATARRHARRGDSADLLAVAAAVRQARVESGLTQAQLALVSGVGRATVIALENGRPGVSLGHALKVMRGLGLTLHPAERR